MPRGSAPVVAVVAVVAITVLAGAAVFAVAPSVTTPPPPQRGVSVSAAADGTVAVTLLSGPPIDPAAVSLRVRVAGTDLAHQPPVPFLSATGFYSGPTGAFNAASAGRWRVGTTTTLVIAPTNDPLPAAGDPVRVTLAVRGHVVAVADTTATPA
ncbi:type IV pilin [Halobacterium salinarum]|nr:type IV pilin [Halobacterium salinarum]